MPQEDSPTMGISEAARALARSESWVRQLIERNKIKTYRSDTGKRVIQRASLERYAAQRKTER